MNSTEVFHLAHELQEQYKAFDLVPIDKVKECCAILDILKQYSILWAIGHKLPKEEWRKNHEHIDSILDLIFEVFEDKEA